MRCSFCICLNSGTSGKTHSQLRFCPHNCMACSGYSFVGLNYEARAAASCHVSMRVAICLFAARACLGSLKGSRIKYYSVAAAVV